MREIVGEMIQGCTWPDREPSGTIPDVNIRKLNRRDRAEWLLDYYEGAKRIRKWYRSKGEAEAAADTVKEQVKHTGQTWIELSPRGAQ